MNPGDTLSTKPGDTTTTEPEVVRGIHFVSGADVSDTALAMLPDPLVVEVHDTAGHVAANVELQVVSTDTAFTPQCAWLYPPFTPCTVPELFLGSSPNAVGDITPVKVRTSSDGRAKIWIYFRSLAGEAAVIVSAPSLGLVDTAHFTIVPGTPVRALIEPHDTTVYLGSSFHLRTGTADQASNIVQPGGASTAEAGVALGEQNEVTANAYGVSRIVLTAGAWTDTATVRVVPHGEVATLYSNFVDAFAIIHLDGSGTMLYPDLGGRARNDGMSWSPDGTQLAYDMGGRIYVQALDGAARRLIAEPPTGLDEEKWPTWSRDGEWIYFSGKRADYPFTIWRASADGATVESLDPERECCENQIHVSPSPDGTRLALISNGGISIIDLATMASTPLGITAGDVRWAPDGTRLAFVAPAGDGGIVAADAGTPQMLNSSFDFSGGFDWSPDGEWLVTRGGLYQISTGLEVPLPYLGDYWKPMWRPQ